MHCTRCQGHMTCDHLVDMQESGGEWWANSWRCINCGYMLDPVLERNRQKSLAMRMAAMASVQAPVAPHIRRQEDLEFDLAA